jgi:hypothetical protein
LVGQLEAVMVEQSVKVKEHELVEMLVQRSGVGMGVLLVGGSDGLSAPLRVGMSETVKEHALVEM